MKKILVIAATLMIALTVSLGVMLKASAQTTTDYYKQYGAFDADKNSVKVDNWDRFIAAYQDESVTKIILIADITDTSKNGPHGPTNYKRQNSLEIDGQNHQLTLKKYHGLRTSEKATGFTEEKSGNPFSRSFFHMHDISIRQNLNGVAAAVGNYSSFAFVGASDVHASWGLEASKYEENMTKNWYFRFGNVTTAQDDNTDNAKGVARLVMAYGAAVSLYGKIDLSTSAENMYVGSLTVEDGTSWTGKTEHYNYATVWFAIDSPKDGTGHSQALTIGKDCQIELANPDHGRDYPAFYGHYGQAVIGENSQVKVNNKGVAWRFDQDKSRLTIKKGANLTLTSTGKGKVIQFGRGPLRSGKVSDCQLTIESGGALFVSGKTDGAGQLSLIDFTGGSLMVPFKGYEAKNCQIKVASGAIFDSQNQATGRHVQRHRTINLRNETNQLIFEDHQLKLWNVKTPVTNQADMILKPIKNLTFQGETSVKVSDDAKGDEALRKLQLKNYRRMTNIVGTIEDYDNDGLPNDLEKILGTDPLNPDTDGDGLTDGVEYHQTLTDPLKVDSDGNGIPDGDEDFDKDGIANLEEIKNGTSPAKADSDDDGLDDLKEKELGTDPLNPDTDGDGLSDGDEILLGLDPLKQKTDGKTLDSERKIGQELSRERINEQFYETNSLFIPKLQAKVAKVLDKHAEIEISDIDNFDNQRALLGSPIELKTDFETTDMTLAIELSESVLSMGEQYNKNLIICKYEGNTLKPLTTSYDGQVISADITSQGIYLVLDNITFLKNLGVDPKSIIDNKIAPRSAKQGLSVEEPKTSTMDNNGHYAAARQKSKVVPPPESNKINAEKVAKQIGRQSTITSGRADIVFVLDSTGSMSDEIANVKNNLGVFAQELLTTYNVQANFALVDYKDISVDGENSTVVVKNKLSNWYTDSDSFKQGLGSIVISGGGDAPESAIDALATAHKLDFRTNAEKFIIIVTDATFKVGNRHGISDMEEMIGLLERDNMMTSVITSSNLKATYQELYEQTGGIYGNIYGNFSQELLKIADNIGENVNEGTWVLLKDFQAVRLDGEVGSRCDTDKDGLYDYEELGKKESLTIKPFITAMCLANNVSPDLYKGKDVVEVYNYTSNPVLPDTDFDGINDKKDREKINGNRFAGLMVDANGSSEYGINDAIPVEYKVNFRRFFTASNTSYHKDLSVLGSLLSSVVYKDRVLDVGEGVSFKGDIIKMLDCYGMSDTKRYQSKNKYGDDDISELGIGHRKIIYQGKEKEVIFVTVRGTNGTVKEWSSNFDVGADTKDYWDQNNPDWDNKHHHKGFDVTANRLNTYIKAYVKQYVSTSAEKVIYITGHSRGAAIANLLGAKYEDDSEYKTYTYTFAAPNTTQDKKNYKTIFNVINTDDIVPQMPLEDWGFTNYGKMKKISVAEKYEKTLSKNKNVSGTFEWLTGRDYNNDGGTKRTLNAFSKVATDRTAIYCKDYNRETLLISWLIPHEYDSYKNNLDKGWRLQRHIYKNNSGHIYQTLAFLMQDLAYLASKGDYKKQYEAYPILGNDVSRKYEAAKKSFIITSGFGNQVPIIGGMAHPHLPQTYYLIAKNNFVGLT